MRSEPILEPMARHLRFCKTLRIIDRRSKVLVDLGCGPTIEYYKFLCRNGVKLKKYLGIDPIINNKIVFDKNRVKLINKSLNKTIPVKSNSADYVIAHAVLEHLNHPKKILFEMIRIIKPGGKVIITTPTPLSKSVLEFLAYRLGVISKREIGEHKYYFNKKIILDMLKGVKSIRVVHNYFEFGLNNLVVINKLKRQNTR